MATTITEDGEIVPNDGEGESVRALTTVDTGALSAIHRVEIDARIATARQYPRSIVQAKRNIEMLATLDEDTAQECCYALVRGQKRKRPGQQQEDDKQNKAIEGPSIRLAEIAAQCWGNNMSDARVVAVNRQEMYVEAEGMFHDLETNSATRATVRRRISTASGRIYSDDMINVTSNAACSIAKRNAILAGIPRGIYRSAYQAARKIIAGDVQSLAENRGKVFKAFAAYGVKPEQILGRLSLQDEMEMTVDDIAVMRGIFASIRNGEATVEDIFAPPGKAEPAHNVVADPLKDEPTAEKVSDAEGDSGGDAGAASGAPESSGTPNETAAVSESAAVDDSGATAKDETAEGGEETLLDRARAAAMGGRAAFQEWQYKIKPAELDELQPHIKSLLAAARAADKATKGE